MVPPQKRQLAWNRLASFVELSNHVIRLNKAHCNLQVTKWHFQNWAALTTSSFSWLWWPLLMYAVLKWLTMYALLTCIIDYRWLNSNLPELKQDCGAKEIMATLIVLPWFQRVKVDLCALRKKRSCVKGSVQSRKKKWVKRGINAVHENGKRENSRTSVLAIQLCVLLSYWNCTCWGCAASLECPALFL